MTYVQGFLAAVPTANKEAFRQHALDAAEVFRKHGALEIKECWAEDVPDGEVTSFPMAVKLAPGEEVVFSWIIWPDKATHDACWENAMPEMEALAEMPFDGKRMIFGGFTPIVEV